MEAAGPVAVAVLDERAPTDHLRLALAVAAAAFAHPGTAVGAPVDLAGEPVGRSAEGLRPRLADGSLGAVLAYVDGQPVGAASIVVADQVAEVVGVGTLPDQRRRGVGGTTTRAVVDLARGRGAEIVFLSAAGEAVARLYRGLGFRQVATAATAARAV